MQISPGNPPPKIAMGFASERALVALQCPFLHSWGFFPYTTGCFSSQILALIMAFLFCRVAMVLNSPFSFPTVAYTILIASSTRSSTDKCWHAAASQCRDEMRQPTLPVPVYMPDGSTSLNEMGNCYLTVLLQYSRIGNQKSCCFEIKVYWGLSFPHPIC